MILVDIGETLSVNKFTIYGVNANNYQYQPKKFQLYVGTERDNLELIADVKDSVVSNKNVYVTFSETKAVRFYKFIVTETHAFSNNYIAYRYAQFRLEFTGINVAVDDDRITLYNSWNRVAKFCTFGHLYIGQGTESNKAVLEFKFTGKQYGINSYVSKEFDGFDLYLDNKFVKRIGVNGDDDAVVPGVYISPTIRNTQHTIRAESNSPFNIDSFILLSDDATVVPPVNETEDGNEEIDEDQDAIFDDEDTNVVDDDNTETSDGDINNTNDNDDKTNTNDNDNSNTDDDDEANTSVDGVDSGTDDDGENDKNNGNNGGNKKNPLSIGAIVGIIAAIIVIIAIAVVVAFCIIKKKKDHSTGLLISTASLPGFDI